ncbi:hypothetical protein B9Z55_007094 [Caenorhabditis nigoni]|uniref:Homeobox domain-containing protein n=1 Tax=Caenorhabditis nigoni TaxID=1611254 RepID=A0A2G5V864_9PELO|nr:hypothetical protein B9Z55_007094 [Caenorhabditis nigoni]
MLSVDIFLISLIRAEIIELKVDSIAYTKERTMSSRNVVSTSLARRTRKAPAPGPSKGPNPKRRPIVDSSESEPEVDIREARPRRKSAKYAIQHENDSDDSPIKRKPGNIRRTEESKEDDFSSSSSSSLESDSDASIFEEETEDEQPEEPSQPSSSRRNRKKKNADEKRRTKMKKTDEQTQMLLAAFNENRYPSLAQRNKLANETKLTESQIRQYFQLHRFKNPPKTLSREEAEPILLEFFRENPTFRGYRSAELRERTGWRRDEIKEFFEKYRRENGAASPLPTKKPSKPCPLPEEESEPILLEIFEKDPEFTDYNNIELKQKIQWKYRKIENWFVRQRKLKHQQEIAHFDGIMETVFQQNQFLRFRDKDLEETTGHSWQKIRNWLRMKRKHTLVSFFKKEISVLPEEMANFERLHKKYEAYTNADKVYEIGMREDVCSDDVVEYFIERQRVLDELKGEAKDGDLEQEEEEERMCRSRMEFENDHIEFDNPRASPIVEDLHGQMEGPVADQYDERDHDLVDRRDDGERNGNEAPNIEPVDSLTHFQQMQATRSSLSLGDFVEKSTDRCRNPRKPYRPRKPDDEGQSSSAMNQDMPNQAMHPPRDVSKIILWSVNVDQPCSSNQSRVPQPRTRNDRSARDDYLVEQFLGKLFEEQQFLGRNRKELSRKTRRREKFLSEWFRNKRMSVLRSFFNKEVPALPVEMANFERIFNSYEFENTTLADVIIQIERTENVYGDDFASYLCERKTITEELRQKVGDQLEGNEEEQVKERLEADQQVAMVENLSTVSSSRNEEEAVQHVVPQEAVQMEFRIDQMEFDHPQEASIDAELHGQEEEPVAFEPEIEDGPIEFENPQLAAIDGEEDDVIPVVPQEAVHMGFENDEIEFENPRNAHLNEDLHGLQVERPVANQQVPSNVKEEIPEIDVKNVERLIAPVKQEMQDPIENVEEEEEEVEQLIVFDVIDHDADEDIESVGPVSILRVQTSFEDLQPYLEDLVGTPEIGFARKSELAENKRSLNYPESLTLPFNCSLHYLGWSEVQVKEFFCQLFPQGTIKKLLEKDLAGCWLYMFQQTEKSYFKRLNKRGSIIGWEQFLTICQEINKIERFKS